MQTSLSRNVWIRLTALVLAVAAATPAPGHGQIAAGFPSTPNRTDRLDPDSKWPAIELDWGVLDAPQSYRGEITIANGCTVPRPIEIFVTGLPTLLVPLEVTVPANGQVEFPYLLDLPSGVAGHMTGQLAVWAPAGADSNCPAARVAFQVNASVVQHAGDGGTRDERSLVDRLDRYDYDDDGDFDEPDGYIDELDVADVGEGDRGYSYDHYYRRFQRAENATVESSRQARLDYWRRARESSSGGTQYALSVSPPSAPMPIESMPVGTLRQYLARHFLSVLPPSAPMPVESMPVGTLRRYLARRFVHTSFTSPLAIASAAVNPEPTATAGVDPAAQRVFSVLSVMEEAPVYGSRRSPLRLLAGWLRPPDPRFSIVSPPRRALAWSRPQKSAGSSPAAAPDDLLVYVTSEGALGAGALRAVLVNGTGMRIRLGTSVAVLEPLARLTAKDVERELTALAHLPQRAVALDGYCLERQKAAPVAGTVFRLAVPGVRARYAPLERVVESARRLRVQKALSPDTDPDDYYHSIVQWAIWADQERFDEKAFAAAFAAYTKKNVIAAGAKWTRDMDAAVAEIVPNRWRDISRIVQNGRAGGGATTGR